MTTLRHERNYGDLENPMTTAINPGCTCGAANFGPGAAHMEGCYVLLLKEAEAVQGVPVVDLSGGDCTCGFPVVNGVSVHLDD